MHLCEIESNGCMLGNYYCLYVYLTEIHYITPPSIRVNLMTVCVTIVLRGEWFGNLFYSSHNDKVYFHLIYVSLKMRQTMEIILCWHKWLPFPCLWLGRAETHIHRPKQREEKNTFVISWLTPKLPRCH